MVRRPRPVVVGLLALLLVPALAVPLGAPSVGARPGVAADGGQAGVAAGGIQTGVAVDEVAGGVPIEVAHDADTTVTRVTVEPDADARWTVKIRTRLATEQDVDQYRSFQRQFRDNTSRFLAPFERRIRGLVGQAANETGREMAASNFSATTSIQQVPRRWGVVAFSFRWSNAARDEGGTLVLGDIFRGGFFLASDDRLIVSAPRGYEIRTAEPRPDSSGPTEVSWTGREDFTDGHPRVVLRPRTTPTATRSETPTASPTPSRDPSGGVALVALAISIITGGLVVLSLRSGLWTDRGPSEQPPVGGDSTESNSEPVGDGPITDTERVERTLAANGGRMKQAAVADELGWSDSKTSRVISEMVEEGRVEKLRIGRENVLDLGDDEE